MPTLLLTSTATARANYYGDEALAGLRQLGTVLLNESDTPLTPRQIIALAEDCAIIVSDRATPGPAEIFDALPNLVAFVRVAVDIRNIDVGAASRNGVLVTHASPGFMAAVSELIVGYMVALARDIVGAALVYRSGSRPEPRMGRQLKGSTIGIIGLGAIGRHLALLARALGMRVVASDPYAVDMPPGVESADLTTLLQLADFVVCLAVANAETENMMGARAFRQMKPGAYFINASRGNLVDEAALESALAEGRIAGAALDVGRAADQMPAPSLAAHPRVIATPHIGGLTPESTAHQALETVRQCAAVLEGRAPPGSVNEAQATRLAKIRATA